MEYIKDNNIINDLSDNFEKNINIKVINNDNLIIKKKKLIELSKNLTKISILILPKSINLTKELILQTP